MVARHVRQSLRLARPLAKSRPVESRLEGLRGPQSPLRTDRHLENWQFARNTVSQPVRSEPKWLGAFLRLDRPSLTSARFAAGMVLAGALAAPLVSGVRAPGGIRSVRTVVDGVGLVVRSSAVPATGFLASKPGASLQGATAVTQSPYREFSIYAYPFGSAAPAEGIETVEPQHLRSYRASGAGRLIRSLRVPARIFSQQVEGSVRVIDIGLGVRDQPTEVVSWLADAGNRLWVIRAAEPLSANARVDAAFAAGTSVEANDLATPTTVAISQLLAPGPAMAVAQHVVVEANSSADPPPVRFPPWWSGDCDVNNNPESFPLSSWDGLTACGPGPNRGGADVPVEFFPAAWGELEWECVELSMRWLYLEYGVRPYPANGSGVVANYSRGTAATSSRSPTTARVCRAQATSSVWSRRPKRATQR